jgi:hypothetical protein
MQADHFERALRLFTRRKRFKPFTIELVSGDRFVVTHPEAVTLRDELAHYVAPDYTYRRFDAETVCQFLSGDMA